MVKRKNPETTTENPETKTKNPATANDRITFDPGPGDPAPAGEQTTAPKRKPGPKPGSKHRPRPPLAEHGNEKPPPELTPAGRVAAIRTARERLDRLIEAEKFVNPAASNWQRTDILFASRGARVKRSAWRHLVGAPVRGLEFVVGAPEADKIPEGNIDEAAGHWEDASEHLGLSPAGAAVLGAVAGTIGTIGQALGRSLRRWWERPAEPTPEPTPEPE